MKKVGLLLVPLLAFSFLTNCGGGAKTKIEDSTVKIFIPDDARNLSFVIDCTSEGKFSVNWGDGTTDSGIEVGEYNHKYSAPGEYTISVSNATGIFLYDLEMDESYVKEVYLSESIIFVGCNNCLSITSMKVSPKNPYYDSRNNCNAIIAKKDLKIQGETYVTANTLIYGCKNTVIPNSVTSIGPGAFAFTDVTSMVIPDSVVSIGYDAFYSCLSLTSLTIPSSVTSVGVDAFFDCPALNFNEYQNIEYLGNDSNKYVIAVNANGNESTYTIRNQCRVLNSYIFKEKNLTSITIPDSVVFIGDSAFESCEQLTGIIVPNGVTSINDYVFAYCDELKSVILPDSITSIGDYAFRNCYALDSINIPDSVESIGTDVFSGTNLTSIKIPNKVKKLSDYMFQSCYELSSVTFPETITEIGNGTFDGCGNITSFKIPNTVTTIGEDAFKQVGFASINIPDSVISLGGSAFSFCENLTSATIGSGLTIIPNNAFYTTGLTSIIIPAQITLIERHAFAHCYSLATMDLTAFTDKNTIPSSDPDAFYESRNLKFEVSSIKMREAFQEKGGGWPATDSKYVIAE